MQDFLVFWGKHKSGISRLSKQAYFKSCQKGSFDADDFTQEAAISVMYCTSKYGSELPPALAYRIIKNRFGTILHAQYLESKYAAQAAVSIEYSEPLNLTSYLLLGQKLSPLSQQVLWVLVDPPDSLWERMYLQETSKISRKIIADYLGVAPQRVSEALKELKEALRVEGAI